MLIKRIAGATRVLGAPADWSEHTDSPCYGLPIRDVVTADGPFMVSAWEPTLEEIAALQRGETLKLWIYGHTHPVVSLSVGEIEL